LRSDLVTQLGHIGWVGDAVAIAVEVEGGGGNAKSEIVTLVTVVTRVMISHMSLNYL